MEEGIDLYAKEGQIETSRNLTGRRGQRGDTEEDVCEALTDIVSMNKRLLRQMRR